MTKPVRRAVTILLVALGTPSIFLALALLPPGSWLIEVFLAPGIALAPILGALVPGKLVLWLVPEGGATAGALLAVAGSSLSWALLAAGIFVLVARKIGSKERGPGILFSG
jgi:hypothetical protein